MPLASYCLYIFLQQRITFTIFLALADSKKRIDAQSFFFFFSMCWPNTSGAMSRKPTRVTGNLQLHIFMLFVPGESVCMCERADSSVVGRMLFLRVGPGDFVHVRPS